MKASELENLGVRRGPLLRRAMEAIKAAARSGMTGLELRTTIRQVIDSPAAWMSHPAFGELATALHNDGQSVHTFVERETPAPWKVWGSDLEPQALDQMRRACQLPVAVAGALMPDAHLGYGLPIGGVLATSGAIIPYAVGVDIACRMRMTVLDLPVSMLSTDHGRQRLTRVLESQTRFGVGSTFTKPHEHEVLDADWNVSQPTLENVNRARMQLGTSGSGNHFVEFGVLTVAAALNASNAGASDAERNHVSGGVSGGVSRGGDAAESGGNEEARSYMNLAPGEYLTLLSHSGSRGTGAAVCAHYSKLAMEQHADLPPELKHLAWLDLDSQAGQEYWHAMNLMGRYAAANHEVIHRSIVRELGATEISMVENHHNFAWKERHDLGDGQGVRELIVHRKGATPANKGVLGVIPGSMATPGFVVQGKAGEGSLTSASHGAGRVMSRTKARSTFAWGNVRRELKEQDVTVLSAGIEEVPGVYKDIHAVMAAQADLVNVLARFDPKLVKMSPEGERPED